MSNRSNNFYAADISNMHHFTSDVLYDYLYSEFYDITPQSGYLFTSPIQESVDDIRCCKYQLYKSIRYIQHKLSVICKHISKDFLESRDVEIVDYSCTQGISAIVMIEQLLNNGFDITRLKRVTIVEPSQLRLSNAIIHLKAKCPKIDVKGVCRQFYEIDLSDIEITSMYCMHIFGDIIENAQYVPYSFIAVLKATRLLFDSFIFFRDVKTENERNLYLANDCDNTYFNKLFAYSKSLCDILELERITSKFNDDWAFMINANHSLNNLSLLNIRDNRIWLDDYITSHITGFRKLCYSEDLLPKTKEFDKNDFWAHFNETDVDIITENFLINIIPEFYKNDPNTFQYIYNKYSSLAESGCYEAYNNLGVIKIMTEYKGIDDENDKNIIEQAIALFKIAADHASSSAKINLLSYYSSINDHMNASLLIDQLIEQNSDEGYWEKAISLFLGIHEPQNIDLAKEYFKALINSNAGLKWRWPRGGYRNPAIYNLSKLALEDATAETLIRILRDLENCNTTFAEQETLKAAILVKLNLYNQAFTVLKGLEERKECRGSQYVLNYNLAICYREGIGCEKDYQKAEEYYKKTLDFNSNGDPCFVQGFWGIGNLYAVWGKISEAEYHYKIAVKYDPDPYCSMRTNLAILNNEDRYQVAIELLNSFNGCKACHEATNYNEDERLCPKCQLWLFTSILSRDNCINLAETHLYSSACQGYADAQYLLGKSRIQSDKEEALKWLELAALQGKHEAQSLLYELAKNGSHVEEVSNEAIRWLALSAKKLACSKTMLYWEYISGYLPNSPKEAINLLLDAAKQKYPMAQYLLGTRLYKTQKKEDGLRFIVLAAKQGHDDSIAWLDAKKEESLEQRKIITKLLYTNPKFTIVDDSEDNCLGADDLVYSKDHKRLLYYVDLYREEVKISQGTICICDECFHESCLNLERIYIPKSVKIIGRYAFNSPINNIISESNSFIVENATLFSADKRVLIRYFGTDEEYIVPEGVEKVEGGALWVSSLRKIILPKSLSIVNGNPFYIKNKERIPIIESNSPIIQVSNDFVIDEIDKVIISYLGKDEHVEISHGIRRIEAYAFEYTKIVSIHLPRTIETIDPKAFYSCLNLKEIHIPYGCKMQFEKIIPNYWLEKPDVSIVESIEEGDFCLANQQYKIDAEEIVQYLTAKGIRCFYHFTDKRNLESIRKCGGLYSWSYCDKNDIIIPMPGGSSDSRTLDVKYGLEDYVRLSFCNDHPMIHRLSQEGADIVLLKVKTSVAMLKDTLFSDINATDKDHHHGGTLEDLKRVNVEATQQHYVSRDSDIFKQHQAEVMVKTYIPLEYIEIPEIHNEDQEELPF